MTGWGFALSRRWLGYLALVVVFAIACTLLSLWQIARRDEARADITRVDTNWEAEPRPITELLPELDAFDPDLKWSPVSLTGRYLVDEQLLARGRPLDGNPGFEVLVPFQLDDGTVFIVDRGWIPAGNEQDTPDSVPAAPQGVVTVVARLKASEPELAGRSAPAGQVATINLPTIADLVGKPTYTGAYGILDSEDPAPATRPAAVVKPAPDEGPHLSYAFQSDDHGHDHKGRLLAQHQHAHAGCNQLQLQPAAWRGGSIAEAAPVGRDEQRRHAHKGR